MINLISRAIRSIFKAESKAEGRYWLSASIIGIGAAFAVKSSASSVQILFDHIDKLMEIYLVFLTMTFTGLLLLQTTLNGAFRERICKDAISPNDGKVYERIGLNILDTYLLNMITIYLIAVIICVLLIFILEPIVNNLIFHGIAFEIISHLVLVAFYIINMRVILTIFSFIAHANHLVLEYAKGEKDTVDTTPPIINPIYPHSNNHTDLNE